MQFVSPDLVKAFLSFRIVLADKLLGKIAATHWKIVNGMKASAGNLLGITPLLADTLHKAVSGNLMASVAWKPATRVADKLHIGRFMARFGATRRTWMAGNLHKPWTTGMAGTLHTDSADKLHKQDVMGSVQCCPASQKLQSFRL